MLYCLENRISSYYINPKLCSTKDVELFGIINTLLYPYNQTCTIAIHFAQLLYCNLVCQNSVTT